MDLLLAAEFPKLANNNLSADLSCKTYLQGVSAAVVVQEEN